MDTKSWPNAIFKSLTELCIIWCHSQVNAFDLQNVNKDISDCADLCLSRERCNHEDEVTMGIPLSSVDLQGFPVTIQICLCNLSANSMFSIYSCSIPLNVCLHMHKCDNISLCLHKHMLVRHCAVLLVSKGYGC